MDDYSGATGRRDLKTLRSLPLDSRGEGQRPPSNPCWGWTFSSVRGRFSGQSWSRSIRRPGSCDGSIFLWGWRGGWCAVVSPPQFDRQAERLPRLLRLSMIEVRSLSPERAARKAAFRLFGQELPVVGGERFAVVVRHLPLRAGRCQCRANFASSGPRERSVLQWGRRCFPGSS